MTAFAKNCEAGENEVEQLKNADETDAQTQTHQTADGGEDVEGVVARVLRHVFLLWRDVVDVELQQTTSHLLLVRHRKLECTRKAHSCWIRKGCHGNAGDVSNCTTSVAAGFCAFSECA